MAARHLLDNFSDGAAPDQKRGEDSRLAERRCVMYSSMSRSGSSMIVTVAGVDDPQPGSVRTRFGGIDIVLHVLNHHRGTTHDVVTCEQCVMDKR